MPPDPEQFSPPLFAQPRQIALAGQQVVYYVSSSLANNYDLSPASYLLANYLPGTLHKKILFRGLSSGAWVSAVMLNSPDNEYTLWDNNFLHLSLADLTLKKNRIDQARICSEISPNQSGPFDLIAIQLPKGRKLARRWLAESAIDLKEDGELYLAGSNDAGIQSVISDAADLFSAPLILAYKKGNRIARFKSNRQQRDLPTWSNEPGIRPDSWYEFSIEIHSKRYQISSLPGVFAYDHLDPGTQYLLDYLPVPLSGEVLDFGCGTGIIGITAASLGASRVDMVDLDLYATASAERNVNQNDIRVARVTTGVGLQPFFETKYDYILSNPPFHSGNRVNYLPAQEFIRDSQQLLRQKGELYLVANRFLQYEDLLQKYYSETICVAANNRYKVLRAMK